MSDHSDCEDSDWWKSFHVIEMADLFLERSSQAELDETIQFLKHQLGLSAGMRVYDQCCGTGTLSNELLKAGVSSVGADLCEIYIQRAKRDAEAIRQSADCSTVDPAADAQFVCNDAFEFVPSQPCHGAFNWYSSFGYASTDDRNMLMLQRAFESLLPGGKFAMDVPNFPHLVRNFQHHLVATGTSDGREVTCVRECTINWNSGQLNQTWRWLSPDRSAVTKQSALRLYWPHQIVEMLLKVGFADVELLGGTDDSSFDMNSARLILLARKPV